MKRRFAGEHVLAFDRRYVLAKFHQLRQKRMRQMTLQSHGLLRIRATFRIAGHIQSAACLLRDKLQPLARNRSPPFRWLLPVNSLRLCRNHCRHLNHRNLVGLAGHR